MQHTSHDGYTNWSSSQLWGQLGGIVLMMVMCIWAKHTAVFYVGEKILIDA